MTGLRYREVIAQLTGIMVGLQRRLRLVLAEILVQIGVHAFVVILRRVIHDARITSSELDVVENSWIIFSALRNFRVRNLLFAFVVRMYDEGSSRLTKLYDETIHGTSRIFIFIIYDDRVRLVSWNTPKRERDFCNAILFFLYRENNFQAQVIDSSEWRKRMSVAQRIAEKRLKQLTNKFAKWASFSSPFSGFGLQRTLPVCVGSEVVQSFLFLSCFTFNHKMQLMRRFACFLIILVAIRAALTCSRSNGSGGFDCAWCVNKPESRIKRECCDYGTIKQVRSFMSFSADVRSMLTSEKKFSFSFM